MAKASVCAGAVVGLALAGLVAPGLAQGATKAAPRVTSVASDHSATTGGKRITLTGSGFTSTSTVLFGGVPGRAVDVVSSAKLRVTAPAHYAVRLNVRVRTASGLSPITSADRFFYHIETKIAAGDFSSCQVTGTGGVRCWGSNLAGQLGNGGTPTRSPTPVPVSGLTGVVSVAVGARHACALTSGGAVYCWGDNGHGQLGDGTMTQRDTPVRVQGLSGQALVLSADGDDTCTVEVDNFLNGINRVKCWGDNTGGQLGIGSTTDFSSPIGPPLNGVVDVDAGDEFTCAVRYTGTVYCWGVNANGQLGTGNRTQALSPVKTLGFRRALLVSSGTESSCAIIAGGAVYCWGANSNGQLGNGATRDNSRPQRVRALTGVRQVSVGGFHACALISGRTFCWGDNKFGQLGDGTTTDRHTPVPIANLTKVDYIAAGQLHSLAVRSTGSAWGWGENGFGQLGDGSMTNRHVPTRVA
jgi:alpha-tubulin suppressor-like RCC1 family protein